MIHKKTKIILCLIIYLALGCSQVPIASISDKSFVQKVSIADCNLLGSIGCMEGNKKSFLLYCKGYISNKTDQNKGYVAIVGIADGTLDSRNSILTNSVACKDQIGNLVWEENGNFVLWNNANIYGNENIIIDLDEAAYQKLRSKTYHMYMAYAQDDTAYVCHSATPIKLTIQDNTLIDHTTLKLQATTYGTQRTDRGIDWLLKGSMAAGSCPENAKLGFILVKEGSKQTPYDMVRKVLASGEAWPTTSTLLNDCIVVPGSLRTSDHVIEGHLLSEQLPIKSGQYKIFCYLSRDNQHHISQMEYILPNTSANSSSAACPPPSITFTGKNYNLKLLDLSICRKQVSGGSTTIQFSDFKIQYTIDHQAVSLPDNLEACLLFLQKGSIWRTAKVEALYKELHATNNVSSMTDDATLCLVTNGCKQLEPSCRDFFSTRSDYEFFICLFSKENNKLIYYTERQEVRTTSSVETPEQEALTLTITEPAQLVLTKNSTGATVKVTFTSPTVSLSGSGVVHEGFLMAKNDSLLDNDLNENKQLVTKHIKSREMESMHEPHCLIFKKAALNISTRIKDLYNDPNATWICNNQLAVIYWVQCTDGSIAFSKPSALSYKEEKEEKEEASSSKEEGTKKTNTTASDSKSNSKSQKTGWFSFLGSKK
ncbi:hypothetical protein [Cardinium endosymbiont of Tipula unca]|uniref:hypothetical protein n=1 Tax=Cardinium endosymbiont of Tipula unca TaxID=3066216 RepID=UPI0030D01F28